MKLKNIAKTYMAAKGLGVFSLVLGAAEILAPVFLSRKLGLKGKQGIIRGYGVREAANGLFLLLSKKPAPWLWTRVAGDAIDLATLAQGKTRNKQQKRNLILALAAVGGVTLIDILTAKAASRK